ncbi:hypothetical protein CYMTET_31897 [Cymbomonas tetramitiformis]|uniref:BLOC-1-related complex subunit 7 n=1 Tax=Cymbomonas tetramitiformis TaxID=36881 RepID=A0AAE0FG35_9CHLO|nr:hypothetical protein CYMTET_31897 [Cymbomonas tetramitiformis]
MSRDGPYSLKRHLTDKGNSIIQDAARLTHILQKRSNSEALEKLPVTMAAKEHTISSTAKMLEKMPELLAKMDAALDGAKFRVDGCVHLQSRGSVGVRSDTRT